MRSRPAAKQQKAPVSVTATRIVQEALKDNVSVGDLSNMAARDAGFALRVVATVNSAAFGVSRTVTDVKQACALLGVRGLKNLALSLVLSDMVPIGPEGQVLLANSLRRAAAARLVAQNLSGVLPDEAFTAGLFLEVGLLAQARDDLAGAATFARIPAAHRVLMERATKSEDHVAAGVRLANEWKLPAATIDAVARHHDVEPPADPLGRVAWAAERVAGVWEGGDMAGLRSTALGALKQIGVSADKGDAILKEIPALVTSVAAAFERDLGAQLTIDELVLDANRRLVEMNQSYETLVRRLEELVAEKERLTEQLRKANLELSTLAATDSLTELPNKRAFLQALDRDLARADREGKSVSLVMLDVDYFKKFNDTYGHQTGDDVLRLVGKILKGAVRTGDVPARYGGEEFAVILPATDGEGARVVAERIRGQLEAASIQGPNGPLRVTASLGVATVSGPGCRQATDDLVGRADAALYQAKHAGRNRVMAAA